MNGHNEPIEFTRGDSERLVKIESGLSSLRRLVSHYVNTQEKINIEHDINTRFRKNMTRILLWVISPAGLAGLFAAVAKAAGWLH